ncbi:unnamed protein product [Rotaria sp. Silwood2]|nr:unnamed protein product [Rotaria sp. Silwood2]CAF4016979.1 unnamed protein product [Rotaria sp. Silwood2]
MKSPSILLQLLQETPNIASLKICKDTLLQMFNNRELCEKMNKTIMKLDITSNEASSCINLNEIVKVGHIFSNIEQLQCCFNLPDKLPLLVNELGKLSNLKLFSFRSRFTYCMNEWLKNHASELNKYSFTIQCKPYEDDDCDDYDDDDDDYQYEFRDYQYDDNDDYSFNHYDLFDFDNYYSNFD